MERLESHASNSAGFARPINDPSNKPPQLEVRYFYASHIQIDDPLAPVSLPTSNSSRAAYPLRPFSDRDNVALDKAWHGISEELKQFRKRKSSIESAAKTTEENGKSPIRVSFLRDAKRSRTGSLRPSSWQESKNVRPPNLGHSRAFSSDAFPHSAPSTGGEMRGTLRLVRTSPLTQDTEARGSDYSDFEADAQGLTGMPFIRAPLRDESRNLRPATPTPSESQEHSLNASDQEDLKPNEELKEPSSAIPVGLGRLHQVSLPKLRMEPIYWRPVHDEFNVIRATWFYKDSMLPIDVDVANMLERGYVELRPWTETWNDELNSALEVGAEGEEKIAHLLWPERPKSNPGNKLDEGTKINAGTAEVDESDKLRQDLLFEAHSIIDKSSLSSDVDNKAAESKEINKTGQRKLFSQSTVIYVNGKEAVILRSNQSPSAYRNRRPYANSIRKGIQIGVSVIRGFDKKAYDRLNQGKNGVKRVNPIEIQNLRQSEWQSFPNLAINSRLLSPDTAHVTDLVLVIHGIGQKLSERVESYNFTHAINSFRREVNVEGGEPTVVPHLRKDMGGIMVLPVNWRSTLSLEEEEYSEEVREEINSFTLGDITPKSIPSVRNIVSDVMLDIPYYLSHHQPRMISAVIKEANRIYRLWCKNNPGFERFGRVHLIAHSLGSVMAIDILSKQPTSTVSAAAPKGENMETNHFIFDTTNLFLCGSPAGFFLLLKKSRLVPRRDKNKPGSEGEDLTPGVAGQCDTYGCLAVDNIYNIVNPYDPVAYQLNATVDAAYAASLKPALIPSASTSWFTLGRTFQQNAYSAPKASAQRQRPGVTIRLPSNVELETHNFTREEIAEKRAYLLNDNGQIDFFMRYGGGPLEIQYLTMLGAHSSYWLSKDFVRMLVIEVGRQPGREGTLRELQASKKKTRLA